MLGRALGGWLGWVPCQIQGGFPGWEPGRALGRVPKGVPIGRVGACFDVVRRRVGRLPLAPLALKLKEEPQLRGRASMHDDPDAFFHRCLHV